MPRENASDALPARLKELVPMLCNNSQVNELRRDLFVAAVVALMMEKGFTPAAVNSDDNFFDEIDQLRRLVSQWKRIDGPYEMKFALNLFLHHFVKLVVTPLGEAMLVNLILTDINSDVYSQCVPLSPHVVAPQAATVPEIYKNLSQLATFMNTNIICPVRSRIIRYHGYESASLVGLPREVSLKIFMYLKVKDILSVSQTCLDMQWIKSDNMLWRALLFRDYSIVLIPVAEDMNYMRAYMMEAHKAQESKAREERSNQRRAGYMHDHMDYSDFVSNIEHYYSFY